MSNNRYHWDRSHPGLTSLQQAIDPLRREVVGHTVYCGLNSIGRVRTFLDRHVFAVWDFMSLLKSLQRGSPTSTCRGSRTARPPAGG